MYINALSDNEATAIGYLKKQPFEKILREKKVAPQSS